MIGFDELAVGDELPRCRRLVTREDVRAYAGASGDRNPLHVDDEVARAVGFEGIIAHGMFTLGHLAACLTDWLGAVDPLVSLRAGFRTPVFLGDTIEAGGKVRALDATERTASIDLWVSVVRDGVTEFPVKRGSAELRFPSEVRG